MPEFVVVVVVVVSVGSLLFVGLFDIVLFFVVCFLFVFFWVVSCLFGVCCLYVVPRSLFFVCMFVCYFLLFVVRFMVFLCFCSKQAKRNNEQEGQTNKEN